MAWAQEGIVVDMDGCFRTSADNSDSKKKHWWLNHCWKFVATTYQKDVEEIQQYVTCQEKCLNLFSGLARSGFWPGVGDHIFLISVYKLIGIDSVVMKKLFAMSEGIEVRG